MTAQASDFAAQIIKEKHTFSSNGTLQWNCDTSGSTTTIQAHGWDLRPRGPSQSPSSSRSDGECEFRTHDDGSPCELPGSHDDGHCHHHTEDQCYAMTDGGTPCENTGHERDNRCHVHSDPDSETGKYSKEARAAFHGLKAAIRFSGKTGQGIDEAQLPEALHIAGYVGKAYLQSEDIAYDPDESEGYLDEKILDDGQTEDEMIQTGLKKAWNKADSGNHKGGARIAVSLADHFLPEFVPPIDEPGGRWSRALGYLGM